ncbi:threonine dehydrogenase-like Zn-dependent dehydrogenase [Streptomyces sp. V3I8]|uniref:hypothetical protein n=1 Tax=Streptomyces sp. V3I8 TaxID=3042279 RepID=UPI0027898939|nr:hypothetical protein [Streptomyces sp. V3I8]MDQ1041250.1 threonine dehydrogenase-like Zn-dependent dehydrogenase [Streptomyces sp. V3I8]
MNRVFQSGTQAERALISRVDGTLVATPGMPDAGLIPSLPAASDVLGTGWFGAVAAQAGPGRPSAPSVPVRQYLPGLIGLVRQRKIDPGKVFGFGLVLPLDQAAEAYRAMGQRRAVEAVLTL